MGEQLSNHMGHMLENILSENDIDPTQVYVTSAVSLPPVDGGRLCIEDIERFSPLLQAEIEALPGINVILALGDLSVKAVYTMHLGGKFTLKEVDQDDIKVKKINGVRRPVKIGKRKIYLVASYNLLYRTEAKFSKSISRALRTVAGTLIRIDRRKKNASTKPISAFFKRQREDTTPQPISKRRKPLGSNAS
mgnify:CR=1 FL=1